METKTITIEGMTCNNCAKNLQGLVSAHAGVSAAQVTFESKALVVTFDAAATNLQAIHEVVEDAGFDVA